MWRFTLLVLVSFIGAIGIFVCGILFANVAHIPSEIDEGCLLLNISHSNYTCAGFFSSKPYYPCSTPYYQIYQDVMRMDKRERTHTCGDDVKYPVCQCCVNSFASKCQPIPIQVDVDKCNPLLYTNMDYYNNLEIGKTYKCWENENGFPSFNEPDSQYRNGLIAGISVSVAMFLIPIIIGVIARIFR